MPSNFLYEVCFILNIDPVRWNGQQDVALTCGINGEAKQIKDFQDVRLRNVDSQNAGYPAVSKPYLRFFQFCRIDIDLFRYNAFTKVFYKVRSPVQGNR
ncbi:hypothetical protein BMS3Bbin07_00519 [bacterium BMS3Bbin07]|nr:hypothetical protein BMS3Bbin07_00519 [bacterium BMS3Bbin07]